MRILERRKEFVYKHMCAQTQRSRKLRLPKDVSDVFAYIRGAHMRNSHCDLSETSLEFTSGLEFEFVIVISIHDSNLLTHVLKKSSLELFFTGMIIQMTIFFFLCPCVSPLENLNSMPEKRW